MRSLKNISTLAIDPARCTGCGLCLDVCPHAAIGLDGQKAFVSDRDACMECGACRRNCPFGAISVQPGVGCAQAILRGMLTGKPPSCGCSCDAGAGNGY